MITRRGFLRGLLGVLAVATLPAASAAPAAAADPRSIAVKAWRWTELPGTGLEVHATRAVTVTYAPDGTVTAPLPLAPPPTGSDRGTQHVTSGPGYGIALRRIGS
jgi:hypothetical protein